ncbi:MAG: aldehyde dehydrogenase family protein [Steroidobacterales bacterium]
MSDAVAPSTPTRFDHWIGGSPVPPLSGAYFDDANPLDDSLYAQAARGGAADVDRAVQAAQRAFATYGESLAKDREQILAQAAVLLERQQSEFIEILVDEIGSPIRKARFEWSLSVGLLRAAAGMARQASGRIPPSDVARRLNLSVRAPLGVVAAITPFNVPLIKGVRLSANALALGNTVVLLPSEDAPVLAGRLARLYDEAGLPDGAFNVVTGMGAEIGDALTTHPLVRFVTFTGSTRVGRHIAALCGQHMKRVTLELGGKSPLVVMRDADLDKAIAAAVHGIFTFQGQVCMGSSRIFVERPIFDQFAERFSQAASRLGIGDLRDPQTVIGPIISERQRARVKGHLDDAVAKGATLLCGGRWRGNRCEPTVLRGVERGMQVFAEETFGPVAALYPIDTLDEAVERANESPYGLSASIFTARLDNAMEFARRVRSGMVHVNATALHDEPHVPFGGTGDSGFGREGTDEDIANMTEWKWITLPQ